MLLRRVIYDEKKQQEILKIIFHIYLTMSDWDKDKQILDVHGNLIPPENGKNYYKDSTAHNIHQFVVFFKNQSFQDEKEIRWVYKENNELYENFGIPFAKKQFRVKGNQIIPYTTSSDLGDIAILSRRERESKNNKLPITKIIVGPQENASLVIKGVKEYLRAFKYNTEIVKQSEVPFRPST